MPPIFSDSEYQSWLPLLTEFLIKIVNAVSLTYFTKTSKSFLFLRRKHLWSDHFFHLTISLIKNLLVTPFPPEKMETVKLIENTAHK